MPVHYDTRTPWLLLFQIRGSIWISVLPYCLANCALAGLIYYLRENEVHVTFSGEGHALMSLMVSYLVVSKVYLAFDRYMNARCATGQAFSTLRELHEQVLTFTARNLTPDAQAWREIAKRSIVELLLMTISILKDERKAIYLARAEETKTNEDPMSSAQSLRLHLYVRSDTYLPEELALLEKSKMLDLLNVYLAAYRELLKLASTPLPFPLVQMGRTFLFLWTFTIPFALVGIVDELYSVILFVFFLTYGFIGLEFVSMKMLHPFGDSKNDLNLEGMGQTIYVSHMRIVNRQL
mmetsp:Transcript_4561/g.12758  ORF Transcript_4561/g.12758 Transcript_4561/m.12758 type:complete len:294 (+) Transcript_4561:276-1157(+)